MSKNCHIVLKRGCMIRVKIVIEGSGRQNDGGMRRKILMREGLDDTTSSCESLPIVVWPAWASAYQALSMQQRNAETGIDLHLL